MSYMGDVQGLGFMQARHASLMQKENYAGEVSRLPDAACKDEPPKLQKVYRTWYTQTMKQGLRIPGWCLGSL